MLHKISILTFLPMKQMTLPFPEANLVYDYKLDDGGISKVPSKDDDEEDAGEKQTKVEHAFLIKLTCKGTCSGKFHGKNKESILHVDQDPQNTHLRPQN